MMVAHEHAALHQDVGSDGANDPAAGTEGETEQSCFSEIAGYLTVLLAVFIGLKLTGYIAWAWWWVLAPIWMPLAFLALFVIAWVAMWKIFKL